MLEITNQQIETPEGKFYVVGRLEFTPHTLVISIRPSGATRMYCELHQKTFGILAECHDCEEEKLQTYNRSRNVGLPAGL